MVSGILMIFFGVGRDNTNHVIYSNWVYVGIALLVATLFGGIMFLIARQRLSEINCDEDY